MLINVFISVSTSLPVKQKLSFLITIFITYSEIIPLQTTRKESNWKTEETLARTVVTVETDRIKLVQSLMFMMMITYSV
jgi:hypothetical protein